MSDIGMPMLATFRNMRKIAYVLLVLVFTSCSEVGQDYDFVIQNITIIDPVKKETVPNQTIYIKDGKIAKVEKSDDKYPSNHTSTINGTGKFAIAGFWNMHTHVCWKENLNELLFPVLLSYGITGVRDMGGDANILNQFKEFIEKNPSLGPELYGAGPIIDGTNQIHPEFSVALTKQNFNRTLDSLAGKKVDFFKVYSLLPIRISKGYF